MEKMLLSPLPDERPRGYLETGKREASRFDDLPDEALVTFGGQILLEAADVVEPDHGHDREDVRPRGAKTEILDDSPTLDRACAEERLQPGHERLGILWGLKQDDMIESLARIRVR